MISYRYLALALLLFAILFAWLAYISPTKSLPSVPTCFEVACRSVLDNYSALLKTATSPGGGFWMYQTYAELAEGFAISALLVALAPPFLRRSMRLRQPLLPRAPKWFAHDLALIVACGFVLFAVLDATWHVSVASQAAVFAVNSFFSWLPLPQTGQMGFVAFVSWCVAVFCVASRGGLLRALKVFGLPAILFLMSMLAIFDSTELVLHVTRFTEWSVGGVWVLSNWTVLVVASTLALNVYTTLGHDHSSPASGRAQESPATGARAWVEAVFAGDSTTQWSRRSSEDVNLRVGRDSSALGLLPAQFDVGIRR